VRSDRDFPADFADRFDSQLEIFGQVGGVALHESKQCLHPSRQGFLVLTEEANELARTPRFYNTLTANRTHLVFDMVRVIHPGVPMDARVLFTGYLPDYAYDLGATDTSVSFEKLRELSKIHDKAAQADADPNFSARIREGIPAPH
jgi:hypothetical protein